MDISTEIYRTLAGQIIRHFLQLAAGVCLSWGVERAVFDTAVSSLAPLVVSAIFAGIAFLYGYLEKKARARFHFDMVEAAFLANPSNTNLMEVKQTVLAKTKAPEQLINQ